MRTNWIAAGLALAGMSCTANDGKDPFNETSSSTTLTTTTTTATTNTTSDGTDSNGTATASGTSGGTTTSDGTTGNSSDSASTSDTNSGTGGIKFDIGNNLDLPGVTDTGNTGCQKIDFLFVVDNSGSMEGEQMNLVNSFPGFIDTIQNTVMAQDYHVLVVDTDAGGGGGCFSSTCCNADCNTWCVQCLANGCDCQCNNAPCPVPPVNDCDVTLGAGKTKSMNDADCGFTSGTRYMLQDQPDLTGTFSCVAEVGTTGNGNELPMDAAIAAITTENQPGECNEGFLRDDAILVVTVITDEEDINKSAGNPPDWVNAMVAAKNNDEKAVVALAIVGDTDLPNPVCMGLNGNDGADASPRLRQWAETFTYGQWGSICAADFTPFFEQAVSVIDSACDDFVPPG